MDKKNIIIIILVLLILTGVGIYAYNYICIQNYNQGFQDAALQINNQIITNLQQNGFITISFPYNETSNYPLKLIPYQSEE